MKSLLQRAITEISLELREVSILMSKSQQWVCFNDTHHQCNDSSTLIALLISESIRLFIHVQLVNLLQWHDNVFDNKQIFELVSISKSQWVCFNDILNAMIYSLSLFYSSVNLIIHSCATSESATMTSSKSISSMSKSISESASMTRLIVSLLERHSKWVCYKDKQRLISWLSRSTNETSSTM